MPPPNSTAASEAQWPPNDFQILCAMRAARMTGTMTPEDVERMDEGPPETWPVDLWNLLGFNPPVGHAE